MSSSSWERHKHVCVIFTQQGGDGVGIAYTAFAFPQGEGQHCDLVVFFGLIIKSFQIILNEPRISTLELLADCGLALLQRN